jgi:ribonuclease HI
LPAASPDKRFVIHADGASRHNPGPAAIGATIKDEKGRLLASISRGIGTATNNQAEYLAAISAVRKAVELGARRVDIYMDSELVIRQVSGLYRTKNAGLKPRLEELKKLLGSLDGYTINHVPRERNREADSLANEALDSPNR